ALTAGAGSSTPPATELPVRNCNRATVQSRLSAACCVPVNCVRLDRLKLPIAWLLSVRGLSNYRQFVFEQPPTCPGQSCCAWILRIDRLAPFGQDVEVGASC